MFKILRSRIFHKILSIAALSFVGCGILMLLASCLLAHHGEGIANRRPSDIARGVGISGSLALVAGAGLGLTNGIQPTVESLLGNGEKPEEGGDETEKEPEPEKEEKEKEEEKEEETKEEEEEKKPEEEQEEEEEKEPEGPKEGQTLEDWVKSFKDQKDLIGALSSLITIEGARQSWSKYKSYIDTLTKQMEKMGKPYAQKWKDSILKLSGKNWRKGDFPNTSKLVDKAGHVMRVIDGLKNVLDKIQKKGYKDPIDIGCALVEETGKQFLTYMATKNPIVALGDTIVSTVSGGKVSISSGINAAADKWDAATQDFFNNIYSNDDKISQQIQDQWNLSKNKIMGNTTISSEEKLSRLKKVYNILYKQ